MTSKKYLILKILFALLFFISCNSPENIEHNNRIIDTVIRYDNQTTAASRCFFIEPIEFPVLYAGIPNILRYSEYLKDSIYIVMKDAKVRLFRNNNHCEIIPSKIGNNVLSVYKKIGSSDSSLVIRKKIKVRKLKKPTTNLSSLKNIKRQTLLSLDKLDCYVVNLPIEIVCKIKSFAIIAFVDNDETEISSSNNKFTQKQKELIKKVRRNNHIIFKDIIAKMPTGDLESVPDFILRVK